jgi:hypothetical protein
VKNPSYACNKKASKDQLTLDSYLPSLKQSKYLKSTVVVERKYKQLTIDCFTKK